MPPSLQAYCINSKRAVLIHPKAAAPTQQCPVFDNTCRCGRIALHCTSRWSCGAVAHSCLQGRRLGFGWRSMQLPHFSLGLPPCRQRSTLSRLCSRRRRGCDKPLRNDCTYCSLKCKADVQYGRVPCTPDVAALEPQPRCARCDRPGQGYW